MRWNNFETPEGQIISIDMDELVAVINYPGDRADLCLKNGTLHTVIFMGQWKTEDQYHVNPLPDWDPEKLRAEIQDLKLENDRLKKRDEIMLKFIKSAYCRDMSCDDCMLYDQTKTTLYKCAYNGSDFFYDISAIAGSVLQEIDKL